MWDLIVTGGRVVMPGSGVIVTDIAVQGSRISGVGQHLGKGRENIDARGRIVFPGVIDPHVHLAIQNSFADEVLTETASALSAGVTTVGVHLRSLKDPYGGQLQRFREEFEAQARSDGFFHLQIFTDQHLEELPDDAAFGATSFKFYMCGLPGVFPAVDDGFLIEGFRAVAALGPEAIACVHAENDAMVARATARLEREKPDGTLSDWARAHPDEAEAEAIHRAAFLAGVAGCRLYIVHLSTALGLAAAQTVKAGRPSIHLETTSPLLAIDKDDAIGLLGKLAPPLRSPSDLDALWGAVREGAIESLGTDNVSRSRAAKRLDRGLHGTATGCPALGTHLPVLLEEGYHKRKVPLEAIARAACEGPARIFGLYPRKGTIAVGSDADLVIIDLDRTRVIRAEDLHSFSDFSPFEGRTVRGWPVTVIKGGEVAVHENTILANPGTGRYLPRPIQA